MANQRSAKNTVIGIHAVEALLIHSPEKIQDLFLNQSRQDEKFAKIISLAKLNHISIQKLTDIPDHSQGVVAMCRASHHSSSPKFSDLKDILENLTKPALFLILDGVQDPHNLGACIRSANAAGVDAVIIPKDRAAPLNETAKKAASGAAEFTNVITVTNLSQTIELLKKHNVWVYGLDGSAQKTLFSQDFKHSTAFVMGSEGEGLRRLTREHCDELIAIPMAGEIESLNVSVAAGICLFEVTRQRLSSRA
ncbi:MAG: 23S rRNA (guanosine(2251)-2'-O)-methyltransferase RlmB [Gammaproteobacteria bacterium]|nr:23S rRNA (guanosine(2251)-2'-O)-methyltransferase RlmB [Gammaproteobacteria bacterium]